jgi:hypothetical protein
MHTYTNIQLPSHLQPASSSSLQISSTIVDLQPEGIAFTVPVTLSLSVTRDQSTSADSNLAVYLFDKRLIDGKPVGWRIISTPQSGQSTTVTATLSHFSMYAVMRAVDARPVAPPIPTPITDNNNNPPQPGMDVLIPPPPGMGNSTGGNDDKFKLEDAQRHEKTLGLALGLALGLPIVGLVAAGEQRIYIYA